MVFDIYLNVLFNRRMESSEHPDWALVTGLGGPTKVADLLGLPKDGGVQRVQNWKFRGIPSAVKVEWPDLFMKAAAARASTAQAAIKNVVQGVA